MSYKILWYSIPALHDNSNGAAIHNKILLEALAARGIQVKVLNALVGDDVKGLAVFDRIKSQLKKDDSENYYQFHDNGVEYVVAKTQGHLSNEVTAADQSRIFDLYLQFLEKFQPDVVMGYSGDVFSAYLRMEARARGIPVVYALCNGLHRSYAFADCDLIFTPSQATSKSYLESDNIDVKAVGQFLDVNKVKDPNRDPANAKYVTLINPTPEKGLAIFAKVAQIFSKKHPEQKFLVVKSVGDYNNILLRLHYADGTPFVVNGVNPIPNVDVAEHTDDIRLVYNITKVLMTPSVWHEAWGCVATEANYNDIPVLSSKSGGLIEAVREGGILLDAPECTQKDYYCVPSDEEVAPWVEALERLLVEDWTAQCRQASDENSLQKSVDRLMTYLQPLLDQGKANKKPIEKSLYFSQKCMDNRMEAYKKAGIIAADGSIVAKPQAQASQEAAVEQAAAAQAAAASVAPDATGEGIAKATDTAPEAKAPAKAAAAKAPAKAKAKSKTSKRK